MNVLIEIVSMFNGKMVVCVGVMMSLSACQMMKVSPYDGVIGYQVTAKKEQGIDLRYSDTDDLSWDVVTKKAIKACAQQLGLPIEQVDSQVKHTDTIEKEVIFNTRIPVPMGSDPMSSSRVAGISSISIRTADRAQRAFKQLDVECSPR